MFDALTAAGGNSRLERAARVKLQWRDRYGRWIEMGRGVKFKVRGADGAPRSVVGSFVGAKDSNTGQVYVSKDPNGLPDGFYDVKSENAQMNIATLSPEQLRQQGIELGKDVNGNAVQERASENIPNVNEIPRADAPEGWRAEPGTYGGKKVITTDEGDFRVHFGGKDDTVLLEDHRASPGVAQPQRSVAEAFLKVSQTDTQREASGDSLYTGLQEGNDTKVSQLGRDELIKSIKLNESTINNERASIDAKQRAMQQNEQIKADLAAKGFDPYDPNEEPGTAETPAPTNAPTASVGDVDTSTFDVAAEGFLVPTGRSTNDITPEGLANFVGANKENLSKGGARLVIDTDAGTAEAHNSADTLDNAKAQAGGLGQNRVLDLNQGKEVSLDTEAVDPNSPDVNPNLDGDTSPEAPNAQDRSTDAVEPQRTDAGSTAPASNPVDQQAPADESARSTGGEPAQRDNNSAGNVGESADPLPAAGSREELEARRTALQRDFDLASPETRVAISEELRRLDQDIARDGGTGPDFRDTVRENGGASVDLSTGEAPTDGYMVAVQGHNLEIPEDVFFDPEKGPNSVKNWIDQNLTQLTKPGMHLGIWHDTENKEVVLDISERFDSREEAERAGRDRNQQAIWDVANGEEINTGGTGDRAEEPSNNSGELPRPDGRGEDVVRDEPNQSDSGSGNSGDNSEQISRLEGRIEELNNRLKDEFAPDTTRQLRSQLDVMQRDLEDLRTRQPEPAPTPEAQPEANTPDVKSLLDTAWQQTDPFPESWIEKRERSALRILRDAEAKGDLQKGIDRLNQDEKDALTDEVAQALGIRQPTPEPRAAEVTPEPTPEPVRTSSAIEAYDQAEANRISVLANPDSTDEDIARAEAEADDAWGALQKGLEAPVSVPEPVDQEQITQDVVDAVMERLDVPAEAPTDPIAVPDTEPVTPEAPEPTNITQEIALRDARIDEVDESERPGGLFTKGNDPFNVESSHESTVLVNLAKLQGKDLDPADRADLEEALRSGQLTDNELAEISQRIDSAPNRANTTTIARPDVEQPEYLSNADIEVINAERDDPSFVFDEDLTWRRILEENPDYTQLDNGDLILETTTNKNKKYDVVVRRTDKNRFLAYVMETDQQSNRRAKRIGNTEWHSYEAFEKRITEARRLINSKSPAGSLARRKDQPTENLGTQGFPADDFLGDIGNPDAALPQTGDDKFDRLLEAVANHLRNGDANLAGIEATLQDIDPGANAINTIMQAVIGRAQDTYKPDPARNWQMYDGERAEIGMHFDWTDWHQELDWWLPNGQLNPDRKPNPTYGLVGRGRVVGYVEANTDGKGHTYGDHVWVQMMQPDGTWGKWVKRSAQTLRRTDENSPLGNPFFSKKEEWRTDPEALARRFRVPVAAPNAPTETIKRPARELVQSRTLRYSARGSLSGYSNVPVPRSQAEIAGLVTREEINSQVMSVKDARPGMLIQRRDDNGDQFIDSIIRVENLGDGMYRVHAARPGSDSALVESFIVSEDQDIALWSSPPLPEPSRPESDNALRGQPVEYEFDGVRENGVVAFDDGEGSLTVIRPNGEVSDILESNITPIESAVSREDRVDALNELDSRDLPEFLKRLIMQGLLSVNLTRNQYDDMLELARSAAQSDNRGRLLDALFDLLGLSSAQKASARRLMNG